MVMIVLLKDAWTCAIASSTFLRVFLAFLGAAAAAAPVWGFCSAMRHAFPGGACIGARTLAAHRQSPAVANAAPGAEVHQALDVHRGLTPQVALDRELGDLRADGVDLRLGEIFHLGRGADACGRARGPGPGAAHTIDMGEPDPHVLV